MIGNVVASRPTRPRILIGDNPAIDSLLTKAPGIAANVGTSAAVSSGAIAAGGALSVAIPVVGIALGAVIGTLFAAHARRVAGAKQENAVLNDLIPTVQQAVSTVFDQLNSGSATPQEGISALEQIEQSYWQAVSQVEQGPGQAGSSAQCVNVSHAGLHITGTPAVQDPPGSNFSGYGPAHFDRSCTASCGVGCMWVASWVNVGIKLIQAGGGQVTFDGVVGNKYGLSNGPPLSIRYTPPAPGSVAATTAAIASGDVASMISAPVLGLPLWMLLVGGFIAWKVLA